MSGKKPKEDRKKEWLARRRASASRKEAGPRCGLCGKTGRLTKTECCGNWICDDEDQYVVFSYARNSCYRNHSHYTLCGYHFNEGHEGRWQDCKQCRDDFKDELEMYVYYGTNEYNFEVLENPPAYEPTKCQSCGEVIVMADGGYMSSGDGYLCARCSVKEHPDLVKFLGRLSENPPELDDDDEEDEEEEETQQGEEQPEGKASRKSSIPQDVQQRVIERVTKFNRKNFRRGTISYVPRFKGKYLYLDRSERGAPSPICRLTWTGREDDWDFAIYKYSSERYDPDEWMFPGSGAVDGTIEGAMIAGLEAYPA